MVFSFKVIDMDFLNSKTVGLLSRLSLLLKSHDNLPREAVIKEKLKNSKRGPNSRKPQGIPAKLLQRLQFREDFHN